MDGGARSMYYKLYEVWIKNVVISALYKTKGTICGKHGINNAYKVKLPNDRNHDKIFNNEDNNNSTEPVFSVFIVCHVVRLRCFAKRLCSHVI